MPQQGSLAPFGVDNGSVTGVGDLQKADQLMQKVSSACQTAVQPAIWCSILKVEVAARAS